MNCKYSIKYYDGDFNASEDSGIAFGTDEAEIVTNLKSYYGDFDEVTLRLDDNFDQVVIPSDYIEENPFNKKNVLD